MHVDPADPVLLRNLAIALFIGALVGVDRQRRAESRGYFGGLRTFMLIALAGASCTWLGQVLGNAWLVVVGLFGLVALLTASYVVVSRVSPDDVGLTGEIAAVIVYLLGGASVAGYPEAAVVVAITVSALLAFKTPLHAVVAAIGEEDQAAALKLLFATFIVLPLLPDHPVDPWGVLVPSRLWWLVVLISGLSLLGWVAIRALGEKRGLLLTGLFGGLVSSTAVTLATARQSKTGGHPSALAMSALTAWAVMFVRVVVAVALVNPMLVPALAWPMGAMALASAGAALYLGRADGEGSHGLALTNPFSLSSAARFAAVFAVILVAVELGRRYLAPSAQYAIAALAGTTDVDAITLSMAQLAGTSIDPGLAARAITVAAASNTVVKLGMALTLGSPELGRRIGAATAVVAVAGALGLLLT
jgi:uncharacterized membrane protein (DUF4010 family)